MKSLIRWSLLATLTFDCSIGRCAEVPDPFKQCEDMLPGRVEVNTRLASPFFQKAELRYPWWIIQHDDGHLESTMGDVSKEDRKKAELTSNCYSTHQGGIHRMEHCEASLAQGELRLFIYGGSPAYFGDLSVKIRGTEFTCAFDANYPTPEADSTVFRITKKQLHVRSSRQKVGARYLAWLSVEFQEGVPKNGSVEWEPKTFKVEGYVKPVIQSGEESVRIKAGAFSVDSPSRWADGVIVEKVPLNPIYTAKEWASMASSPGKSKLTDLNGVKVEISPVLKPSYANRPQHWAIRFPKLVVAGQEFDAKEAANEATSPQILIHKSSEWGNAAENGKLDAAEGKRTVRRLRRALDNMDPKGAPIYSYGDFRAMKRPLKFRGGSGFRMLMQFAMEPTILERGRLEYVFVGMSDDNSCQIVATFPIDLPGLPDGTEGGEHLGFSNSSYPELAKRYPNYQTKARKWLAANARKITPSLAELDSMIQSLDVRTWK